MTPFAGRSWVLSVSVTLLPNEFQFATSFTQGCACIPSAWSSLTNQGTATVVLPSCPTKLSSGRGRPSFQRRATAPKKKADALRVHIPRHGVPLSPQKASDAVTGLLGDVFVVRGTPVNAVMYLTCYHAQVRPPRASRNCKRHPAQPWQPRTCRPAPRPLPPAQPTRPATQRGHGRYTDTRQRHRARSPVRNRHATTALLEPQVQGHGRRQRVPGLPAFLAHPSPSAPLRRHPQTHRLSRLSHL